MSQKSSEALFKMTQWPISHRNRAVMMPGSHPAAENCHLREWKMDVKLISCPQNNSIISFPGNVKWFINRSVRQRFISWLLFDLVCVTLSPEKRSFEAEKMQLLHDKSMCVNLLAEFTPLTGLEVTLEHFLDRRRVADEAHGHLQPLRRDIADSALHLTHFI